MEDAEIFRRLMADATGKLEDAAMLAVDGQAKGVHAQTRHQLTRDIERLARDAAALYRAARCVLGAGPPDN
jgi:hypothetical protein